MKWLSLQPWRAGGSWAKLGLPAYCLYKDLPAKSSQLSLSQKADIFGFTMFWSPSFDGMADLTPYFNHVIASYNGIQNVPHVQVKWGRLLRQAQFSLIRPTFPAQMECRQN